MRHLIVSAFLLLSLVVAALATVYPAALWALLLTAPLGLLALHKPGHGGILPANKVTHEIAEIRGVPMGHDVLNPPATGKIYSGFSMVKILALGAMGLESPQQLRPWHVLRRVSINETKHYGELYDYLDHEELLREPYPPDYERAVKAASADDFHYHGPRISDGGVVLS